MGLEGAKRNIETQGIVHLPEDITDEFMANTLQDEKQLIFNSNQEKRWRVYKTRTHVPHGEDMLLRVDYGRFRSDKEQFDQMRFDYVSAEPNELGNHRMIGEMHWYIEKGEWDNPFHFDLMLSHRYVIPEYRNRQGIGTHLYRQAEAWAQQVAEKKNQSLTLALSTDQPLTMDWAEKMGYAPSSPEQQKRRREFLEHPELFIVHTPMAAGQSRNPSIHRKDRDYVDSAQRVWFQKILTPAKQR